MASEAVPLEWVRRFGKELAYLIERSMKAFRQRRTAERAWSYIVGVFLLLGTCRVSNVIRVLGAVSEDHCAFYRLFSRERIDFDLAETILLHELLRVWEEVEGPIVCVGDDVEISRTGDHFPGVGWTRARRTAAFRPGLERAQRFFTFTVLLPRDERGYTRGVCLPWEPAFTKESEQWPKRKRTEALLEVLNRVRAAIPGRPILLLLDGAYDTAELWSKLPAGVWVMVRTPRNRVLYHLPKRPKRRRRGRPRRWGKRAPLPSQWLRVREGWQQTEIKVRGRDVRLKYRVEGPYWRSQVAEVPVFLVAVRGSSKRTGRGRKPAFFLVRGVWRGSRYELPLPIEELLAWYWQRWEVEVMHRDVKTGLGLKHAQNTSEAGSVSIVKWVTCAYGLAVLAGYRAWGLRNPRGRTVRWWAGSGRWTLQTLSDAIRELVLGRLEFRPSRRGILSRLRKIRRPERLMANVILAMGHA